MEDMTPRQIVAELDKYIVGQKAAKRAVAIALRNRYRRRRLADDLRDEVIPKNILMIGPTGVGKTEMPGGWQRWLMPRLSKSKPPSLPKSAMSGATWTRGCVI